MITPQPPCAQQGPQYKLNPPETRLPANMKNWAITIYTFNRNSRTKTSLNFTCSRVPNTSPQRFALLKIPSLTTIKLVIFLQAVTTMYFTILFFIFLNNYSDKKDNSKDKQLR